MSAPPLVLMLYFCIISISILFEDFYTAAADSNYYLYSNNSITNGESLVSPNQRFELGFFNPTSTTSYLGIWYKDFPDIIAWVANRETPLINSPGTLTISPDGNLIILNSSNYIIWSSNSSPSSTATINVRNYNSSLILYLQLLDSGNLVLTQNSSNNYLWQSFDYPGNTLLPGMKIGWDWVTGRSWNMTSWKDSNDPSPGSLEYGLELIGGLADLVIRQGSEKIYRTGIWNGMGFNGIFDPIPTSSLFNYDFVNDSDEMYYYHPFTNDPLITRLTLNQTGAIQRYALKEGTGVWDLEYAGPNDVCDEYNICGANGICNINDSPNYCGCLRGFVPGSMKEGDPLDGCVRRKALDCVKGDGFLTVKKSKMPDLLVNQFGLNMNMSLKDCEKECLRNCSCTAYANPYATGKGNGCLTWYGDLIDIREGVSDLNNAEQNFYIRLAASELAHDTQKKTVVVTTTVISAVVVMLSLVFIIWWRIQKFKRIRERNKDIDIPMFDLATVASATNNFTNMIGSGGFGCVYKGKIISTGQEVAVKRLYKDSGQGAQQFKNEIILISKLQHKNLVRTVGCCVEGKEQILVYEYMPNQSLDYFIFGEKRSILKWQNRFEIAIGVAKGLVYLHHDSRLKIIHRDLKASNVLLDNEMNPKISDFGIARIFGGDQNEARTNIVIGTYGYMSPEYIIDGKFSTKSDVFSYGMLLLEMVSGKRSTRFSNPEHYHGLAGHAWVFWNEGKALEIVDECLVDTSMEYSQVERCIQISLLCVQRLPKDRPTMSSVVSMLGNESIALPEPKQPGFFIERYSAQAEATIRECTNGNQLTLTIPQPR